MADSTHLLHAGIDREIEQMIASVQSTARHAVDSISRNSGARAQGTLEITQASGVVLEDIFAAIGQINSRTTWWCQRRREQALVREVDSSLLAIATCRRNPRRAPCRPTQRAETRCRSLAAELSRPGGRLSDLILGVRPHAA